MFTARPSRSAVGLGVAALLFAVAGGAAVPDACLAPRLSVQVPPGPAWQSAPEQLEQHLRGLRDLDKCARVSIRPRGSGVLLLITTSDERTAARQVETTAELLRACEALLILPPQPAAEPLKPSPLEVPPLEPRSVSPRTATVHLDFGLGASLRFGGGALYGGGGVAGFAALIIDRWVVSLMARWDAADAYFTQPTPSDFIMQSSAVGASVGRRLELGNANLDAMLGPNLVLESQDADDGDREVHGASDEFRVSLAVRVSGPRSSAVRAFATSDFEASPARIRSRKYLDRALPQLPWWSSGLAVGVLWGAK